MQRSRLALAPYPTFPAISLALMFVKGHTFFSREIKAASGVGGLGGRGGGRCSFTSPSACTATAGLPNITTVRFQTLEVSQRFAPPAPPTFFLFLLPAIFVSGRSIKCLPWIRSQSHFSFFLPPLVEVDLAAADYPALIKPAGETRRAGFFFFFTAAQKLFCFLIK